MAARTNFETAAYTVIDATQTSSWCCAVRMPTAR